MHVVLASLLVLLAVANADLVDVATAGVLQIGTLGITTSATQADYYKVWIPSNANNISLTFDVTGTTLCDLYLAYSFDVIPCGPSWDFNGLDNYCDSVSSNNVESYSSSHPNSETLDARDSDFEVGKYLYLSVSRYSPNVMNTICGYTFTVDVSTCAAGQGSAYSYADSAFVCAPVTNVTFTSQAARVDVTNVGSFKAFAMMLPLNVGTLTITANTTSTSTELYAGTGATASFYHKQYSGGNVVTGYYEIEVTTPEAGWFYFTIEDDSGDLYNATILFSYTVCPIGFGGYNCTYPVMMFNATKYNGVPMQLSPNMTSFNDYGPLVYYYVDFPANSTENVYLNISSQGSGYVYYRFNGYPEYNSNYGSELEFSTGSLVELALSWQNLYVGGRFFIGIQNIMSDSWLNYTFAGAASGGSTSTGATTGATVATIGTSTGTSGTSGNDTTTGMVTGSVTSGNDTDTTTGSSTMAPDTTTSAAGIVGASVVVLALVLAVL